MKTFYSNEDIEALARQGITELRLDEDTVLTHLARDTAHRLGISLVHAGSSPRPAPSAAAPSSSSTRATPMAAKPKGCQHGPLVNGAAGGGGGASGADGTVSELIGLVRKLADKDAKS
jgi:hypothetical protein